MVTVSRVSTGAFNTQYQMFTIAPVNEEEIVNGAPTHPGLQDIERRSCAASATATYVVGRTSSVITEFVFDKDTPEVNVALPFEDALAVATVPRRNTRSDATFDRVMILSAPASGKAEVAMFNAKKKALQFGKTMKLSVGGVVDAVYDGSGHVYVLTATQIVVVDVSDEDVQPEEEEVWPLADAEGKTIKNAAHIMYDEESGWIVVTTSGLKGQVWLVNSRVAAERGVSGGLVASVYNEKNGVAISAATLMTMVTDEKVDVIATDESPSVLHSILMPSTRAPRFSVLFKALTVTGIIALLVGGVGVGALVATGKLSGGGGSGGLRSVEHRPAPARSGSSHRSPRRAGGAGRSSSGGKSKNSFM